MLCWWLVKLRVPVVVIGGHPEVRRTWVSGSRRRFPFTCYLLSLSGGVWWFLRFSSDLWVVGELQCVPVGVLGFPAVSRCRQLFRPSEFRKTFFPATKRVVLPHGGLGFSSVASGEWFFYLLLLFHRESGCFGGFSVASFL